MIFQENVTKQLIAQGSKLELGRIEILEILSVVPPGVPVALAVGLLPN